MKQLQDYFATVQELSRERFAQHFIRPFFVRRSKSANDTDWRFTTQSVSSADISLRRFLAEVGVELSPEVAHLRVFELVNTEGSPWSERVSIGRARNNDLALPDASVSKLHAYAFIDVGATSLQDAGSRNGTFVNRRRLGPTDKVGLGSGDEVTFGRVDMVYFDARGLYDFISKNVQRR
jgi:pSer/pThr/pTyr-binding forkhead associated (FHA) protein